MCASGGDRLSETLRGYELRVGRMGAALVTFRRKGLDERQLGLLARSRTSPKLFGDFYEDMSPVVLRYFARHTRNPQVAFDLMAVTFSNAYAKRKDFRGSSDEDARAWVWKIARNELARFRRRRSVELAALKRLGLERPTSSDQELRDVELLIAIEEVRGRIEVALDTLSPDQQEVMRLRFEEDLSDHEIAERLSVSHDVVRARASRARRSLRASGLLQGTMELFDT